MHTLILVARVTILVASIAVIALSLTTYSTNAIPIFRVLTESQQQHRDDVAFSQIVLMEMVRDRRLISTLVAAQASVFCPLFLVLVNHQINSQPQSAVPSTIELVSHILMSLGLAMSWQFSIFFDNKTQSVIAPTEQTGIALAIYGLKYMIFGTLLLETGLVCFFELFGKSRPGAIHLSDEEQAIIVEKGFDET